MKPRVSFFGKLGACLAVVALAVSTFLCDAQAGGKGYFGSGLINRPTKAYGQNALSFFAPLQTSLVPTIAAGSNTPTMVRATTAYQQDFEGKQNLVLSGEARFQGARRVSNLCTVPENSATWSTTTATKTTGQTDPLGGTAAVTITATSANGGAYIGSTATSPTRTYINAVYVKRRVGTGSIYLRHPDGILGSKVEITSVLTTSWKRFSVGTSTNDGVVTAYAFVVDIATSGDAVDIAFPQLEDVTGQTNQNPSEYVSVGVLSAPYQGAGVDGVQYFNTLNGNTVSSNIVSEATGAPIVAGAAGVSATAPVDAGGPYGYLAEGARADVLGTTAAIRRTMTDVGWVNTNMTVGAATGVDGVGSAGASLTATAGNATTLFTTVLGAAVRTYSVWARRKTGTGVVNMTKDGGATWTAITLTSVYQQFQVTTASAANPVVGFQIVTSGDAIEVDFNTLEAATFANPTPIPVNVSKAADVLTYPSAGNISGTVGSAYAEFMTAAPSGAIVALSNGVSGRMHTLQGSQVLTDAEIWDGTTFVTKTGLASIGTAMRKRAASWSGSTMSVTGDGAAVASGAFDGSMGNSAAIQVGHDGSGTVSLFGAIRNVRLYPTALSAAKLTSMTTAEATGWLGDPWWNVAANDEIYRIAANWR